MSRTKPTIGITYHIYNRGVEKRDVFLDDKDYSRFIHYLYLLNDMTRRVNINRRAEMIEVEPQSFDREPLVNIQAFALMPNHYHLMLRGLTEDSISKFMQKLGTGYTMYFNDRYRRSSGLFQGRFKSVPVVTHSQLLYLPHYIHSNPLALELTGISNIEKLNNYRWSSFLDYIGKRNFPSVLHGDEIIQMFGSKKKYRDDLQYNIDTPNSTYLDALRTIAIDM